MHTLKPFAPNENAIEVHGQLVWSESELKIQFALKDPKNQVLDSLHTGTWKHWDRADELWKTTCFEAFFGHPDQTDYWELNLSPAKMKWNLYFFDNYRTPQPPRRSFDFELSDIKMTRESLACTLTSAVNLNNFEASLCAVIRTTKGPHYHSLQHAGEKPDFHDRRSFIKS